MGGYYRSVDSEASARDAYPVFTLYSRDYSRKVEAEYFVHSEVVKNRLVDRYIEWP